VVAWPWELTLAAPHDEVEAACSHGARRCVLIAVVDPGDGHRETLEVQLGATLASLQAGLDFPVMVIWYGEDARAAERAEASLPPCTLMHRASFSEELERLVPGSSSQLEPWGPVLVTFVALQSFVVMEMDQLLCLIPGAVLEQPAWRVFERNGEAEVHAVPRASGLPGQAGLLEALGLPPGRPFSSHALLYNWRSWLKVCRWTEAMVQFLLRARAEFPCPGGGSGALQQEELAAFCALSLAGVQIGELMGLEPHGRCREPAGEQEAPFGAEWVAVD